MGFYGFCTYESPRLLLSYRSFDFYIGVWYLARPMRWILTLFLAIAFGEHGLATQKTKIPASCPSSNNQAVTTPASVNTAEIIDVLKTLQTKDGKTALSITKDVEKEVVKIFDTSRTKTKMEQFYSLLYLINLAKVAKPGKAVEFEPKGVQKILLASKVFTDPALPNRIQSIVVTERRIKKPTYYIRFDQKETHLPLNNGEGFYLFQNGKCQHAQKLIFKDEFAVTLMKNNKNHVVAYDFEGVNLFGDFGNRGVFDVDIQYVVFSRVEFLHGTVDGKVTIYVARKEFEKNEHNVLLRMITKVIPDWSVQPIDW